MECLHSHLPVEITSKLLPNHRCCCLVAKSCPTLLGPHGLQPAMSLCPWDSPGNNTGVGCHFPLLGIFTTQGSNLHWTKITGCHMRGQNKVWIRIAQTILKKITRKEIVSPNNKTLSNYDQANIELAIQNQTHPSIIQSPEVWTLDPKQMKR